MLRIREGDLDLLAVLYSRHHERLRGFLFHFLGDPATADDLVQTVFLRILLHRGQFQGKGSFSAWMYRIARNAALDWIKAETIRRPGSAQTTAETCPDPGPDAEAAACHRERREILERALGRLRRQDREIIALSKVEGLRCREIAGILGCSEGTVKVRVFRALQALKREVGAVERGEIS